MPPDAVARSVAHLPQRKIWQRYVFAFNPVKPSLFALAYLVAYLCAIATFAVIVTYPIAAAPTKEVRRILILNEENATYPGISIINQGIQAGLNDSPYHLQLYSEYMDTSLFPDQAVQQELRYAYIRKYQDRELDLIITVGPSPLKFMQEVHQKAFPGVPIVFCLPTLSATGPPTLDSDFTGVDNDTAPAETVRIALRLVPGTRNVVVVGGVAPIDREVLANVKKELMSYEGRVEISYLTDLAMPDLLQRLRRLPSNTIILLTSIGQDAARTSFKSNESSPLIIGAANVPVFSLFDVHLDHGEVGGYLSSLREQGKVSGSMALRILKGEKASQIPRVKGVNTYMFDWRALKRWGLRESDLPPGSTVLFREVSVWERTKRIWIIVLIVILALSLLSTYLHYSRAELKKARDAQVQLSGHIIDAQEKERSRLASELHDDFSQRLALLALRLENTAETLPDSSNTQKQSLDECRQSVAELGSDLHSLSHQLHSSTLDTLGLVAGLSSLCREFGAWQGIEIDFTSADIPPSVKPDVALCLFRITQEGLQNLRKHSNTKRAQLSVRHMGDKLFLSLCDEGVGFDANTLEKPGLGILSMRGRARLLGGDFEIHSKPGRGTRIEAWVPLDEPVADQLNV